MPLRPQLESLLESANEFRATAAKQLDALLPEQLAWKPSPDRWSILQILDHLNKSGATLLPRFEEALRVGTAAGHEREETIRPGFIDRMFLRMVSVNPPFKMPVPPMLEPSESPDPEETVREFLRIHDALTDVIVRADDFRLREMNIVSPVSPRLKPNFMTYLLGIFSHERYHWNQAEALLADPRFPGNPI